MFEEKRNTVKKQTGRAHRYKPTSLKLIPQVGHEARILDLGGGDRILDLPNFVNLDIIRSSRFVTIIADTHFFALQRGRFRFSLVRSRD